MIDISAALTRASSIRRPLHSAQTHEFVAAALASVDAETDWDIDAGERWAWTQGATFPKYACIYALSPFVFCGEGQSVSITNVVQAEVLEVPDINDLCLCADTEALFSLFGADVPMLDGKDPNSGIDPTKFSVQELYFWTV